MVEVKFFTFKYMLKHRILLLPLSAAAAQLMFAVACVTFYSEDRRIHEELHLRQISLRTTKGGERSSAGESHDDGLDILLVL